MSSRSGSRSTSTIRASSSARRSTTSSTPRRSSTPAAGSLRRALQVGRGFGDPLGDDRERLVAVRVLRHGFGVRRERLKLSERCALPEDGAEDDRDDPRVAALVTGHRAFELDVVAVVGGEEVRADQQEDDLRLLEPLVDLTLPVGAGADLPVVPLPDDALPAEDREVLLELVAELLVPVRVRVEQLQAA